MSFSFLFYKHVMLRKCCQNCKYCNLHRPSDITIADYWGWQKTDPIINADDKGISLVLLNTEKGRKLFETIKDKMKTIPADLDDCMQPNLQHPTKFNPNRAKFERDYKNKGFEYVFKKYSEDSFISIVQLYKNKIITKLKSAIRIIRGK